VVDPLFSAYGSNWTSPAGLCAGSCTPTNPCTITVPTSIPSPGADQCTSCSGSYDVVNTVTLVPVAGNTTLATANATTTRTCGACSIVTTIGGTTTRVWSW
jgi:hypothetical protein